MMGADFDADAVGHELRSALDEAHRDEAVGPYTSGWNDAMAHAARIADSLVASAVYPPSWPEGKEWAEKILARDDPAAGNVAPCWFCHRAVPIDYLIAGYDSLETQRLACLDCDRAIHALRDKGWLPSGSLALDDAWRQAEAVLPEGARLACQRRPEDGPYEAWAQSGDRIGLGFAYGDTPADALRALIEMLERR
jgi:hypothetical protein